MAPDPKAVAQHVLQTGCYAFPIDLYQVARDQGLTVTEQNLEDEVSGLLVIRDGRGIIGVNQHHHVNRQRFTIAHEIGHY